MNTVSSFSNRLKDLIDGQTYDQVSAKIGVAKSTVCAYVKGDRVPRKPGLMNIARAYGVSPLWLMGYDVEKNSDPVFSEPEDVELTEYLETLRTRPECRMLFSLAKDATKADVEKAVAIIEALRGVGDK